MNSYHRISVFEADAILKQNTTAVLIDCRDSVAFDDSRHPRARFLNENLFAQIVRKIPKDSPIIVYCYMGYKSREIATTFADFGFQKCYSVDGGYAAWKHQIPQKFSVGINLKRWLLRRGLNPTDINCRCDSENCTPLMLAARNGTTQIVRDLIDAGADPNLTDTNGNNALWYACMAQSTECVEVLINADIEVENQNYKGFAAIDYAAGLEPIYSLLAPYSNIALKSAHA